MDRKFYQRLSLAALLLCFVVVTLGAYVRLSDAGLGCPDWPGCYGHLVGVPDTEHQVATAESAYPERPVETAKAWKEVIHRYAAGTLGLLILGMFLITLFRGRRIGISPLLPGLLCGLVLFQALLGMWTVTLLLKPAIVTAHLLGGMTILALLLLAVLKASAVKEKQPTQRFAGREPRNEREAMQALRATDTSAPIPAAVRGVGVLAPLVLLLLIGQLFLGAWTSSNYAALACPDLPTCQGSLWPETDFEEAFMLWRGLGVNYEFGVLDSAARATIHVMHRIGAITVTVFAIWLMALLWRSTGRWRHYAVLVGVTLLLQLSIGIAIVIQQLPLPLAVAHNGGAALLLLALVATNYRVWRLRHATN